MRRVFCLAFVAMMAFTANAAVTFNADLVGTGGIAPTTTYTSIIPGLTDNGVTFDVTYTVVGSADLTGGPGTGVGLGILGGTNGVNNGETLTFSIATSNVSGGTVTGGLDNVTFDLGTLALNGTPNDSFTGSFGTDVVAQSLQATFTGVSAVPEPSSMTALAVLGLGVVVRRRRRS